MEGGGKISVGGVVLLLVLVAAAVVNVVIKPWDWE